MQMLAGHSAGGVSAFLLGHGQTAQFPLSPSAVVYPKDLDSSTEKVSVFAPVGSALLGLSVGDELTWPSVGGKHMTVRVTGIVYQPERAGELHR